jgi:AraC family transcriptional regulator
MIEHLDQLIGLDELATQARLSRYYFCTAFRVATGRTPHAWLTEQRMLRARRLLTDTSLSVGDIAYRVGYASQSAFAATFRRVVGMTPSRCRQDR